MHYWTSLRTTRYLLILPLSIVPRPAAPPNHHKFFKHPPKPIVESVWRGCTFSGQGDFKMKWILTSTFVVLIILTQGAAVAFSPSAEEPVAEDDPVIGACPLPGLYVAASSCTTGFHTYQEGMTQELTGLSFSDFGGTVTSTMSWGGGSFSLRCEYVFAAGDTLPLCETSGSEPDVGVDFEHRCSTSRATAAVAVCTLRNNPTA